MSEDAQTELVDDLALDVSAVQQRAQQPIGNRLHEQVLSLGAHEVRVVLVLVAPRPVAADNDTELAPAMQSLLQEIDMVLSIINERIAEENIPFDHAHAMDDFGD